MAWIFCFYVLFPRESYVFLVIAVWRGKEIGFYENENLPRSVETFSNWLRAAPAFADKKVSSSGVS